MGASEIPVGIYTHPEGRTVCEGLVSEVALECGACGTRPFEYQWRKNGEDIPEATESSYTVAPLVAGTSDSYDVVVTNVAGSVTSDPAVVTVIAAEPGDCQPNGLPAGEEILGNDGADPVFLTHHRIAQTFRQGSGQGCGQRGDEVDPV